MNISRQSSVVSRQINAWIGILFILAITFTAYTAYAEMLSSNELIEKAKELDGKKVHYKGEVITAVLRQGDHSWINVNDGYNAIGIWCKNTRLDAIQFVGDYKHKGDIVEVEGIFSRACPLHGGELDIHAYKITIMKSGSFIDETLDKKRIHSTMALFLVTLLMIAIFRRRL